MAESMYARIEGGAIVDWSTIPTQPPLTVRQQFTGPASVTNALGQTVELLDGETRDIEIVNPEPQKDWRPLVLQWPDFDKATHQVGDPTDTVQADKVVRSWSVAPRSDLAAVKAELKANVAADAEACRLRFITPGAGQAMTYLEKHNQANAVHEMGQSSGLPYDAAAAQAAANSLTETEYRSMFPTLAASVGVEAATLWDAAELVIARYEAWATLSFQIERARLAGSKAIGDASDAAAARAAYEAITWPTP